MTPAQKNKLRAELKSLQRQRREMAGHVSVGLSNIEAYTDTDSADDMESLASEAEGLASDAGRLAEALSRIEDIEDELRDAEGDD